MVTVRRSIGVLVCVLHVDCVPFRPVRLRSRRPRPDPCSPRSSACLRLPFVNRSGSRPHSASSILVDCFASAAFVGSVHLRRRRLHPGLSRPRLDRFVARPCLFVSEWCSSLASPDRVPVRPRSSAAVCSPDSTPASSSVRLCRASSVSDPLVVLLRSAFLVVCYGGPSCCCRLLLVDAVQCCVRVHRRSLLLRTSTPGSPSSL